jgi:5-methyltetrahydropteroyltriglutamate--homocysteine methyltransferase
MENRCIATEPIGSIPRPRKLIDGMLAFNEGRIAKKALDALVAEALRDTIARFEATGSPVITDGEQSKPSFATYPIAGLERLAPDGVAISFADGHSRRLPRLAARPFRYRMYADGYLRAAKKYARVPVKQEVISASALSLLYPPGGIPGYSKDAFIEDLLREHETDIRRCLRRGAHKVQIDFTEGRLALKLDASGALLKSFVELENRVLQRFSAEERRRIGVHICPGGDQDSIHSADIDYAELLPQLFKLEAGNFYIQLASEPDRARMLKIIGEESRDDQSIFVGVIDPIAAHVETPAEVYDRIREAAEYIPLSRLGTTDDRGFAPFGGDTSRSRETAFEKIRARVAGTALAAKVLR